MKKTLARSLALASLLFLSIVLPGCSSYDYDGGSYGYPTVGVGVSVYSGGYGYGSYGGSGWGSCCYGGSTLPAVMPRPVHY